MARNLKREAKAEAIRKHNERFEYLKANPVSTTEQIQQAFLEVLKSVK